MKINKILTFIFIKNEGDNQEPKIKRNRQHLVHKTKTNKNEKKTAQQYVLDTTMLKQTQLT